LHFANIAIVWDATKRYETDRDILERIAGMPILIDGIRYFFADEVAKEVRVSRTTFWRWRSEGKIPKGRKYRGGKMVLFSEEEFEVVRGFANHLEPVEGSNRDQMKLFNGVR
jgi:predicted DNA-binding transcriptional regulator AlpA